MDEMTLTLNNPLTEEEWDLIEDVDFDKTNSIEFHTKHGKTVKFVKCIDERAGDLISRHVAVDEFPEDTLPWDTFDGYVAPHHVRKILEQLPSAQSERTVYENMSDEQFEEWLYEHGICNPDIHESIPCSVVPLLIDNAINELLPQEHKIILCKDCKHRPTRDKDGELDFPTSRCPCQCDDFYYSWMPNAEWFCGNAERRGK